MSSSPPSSSFTPTAPKTRKSHGKSRLGCLNCKQRRIKCNEARPQCSHCIKRRVRCDFLPAPDPSEPDSATDVAWADLELLHHFTTAAAHTLADAGAAARMWLVDVPRTGFAHAFVLHLVLAFAAQHLAHHRASSPSSSSRARSPHQLRVAAERHHLLGLRGTAHALAHLDAANCTAVYTASVLVSFCHFARGPQPGEFLVFAAAAAAADADAEAKTQKAEWFGLMRGVRALVEAGLPIDMAPSARGASREYPAVDLAALGPLADAKRDRGVRRTEYAAAVDELRRNVRALFPDARDAAQQLALDECLGAVGLLEGTYAHVFGAHDTAVAESSPSPPPPDLTPATAVFRWLYLASDAFALQLRHKRAAALVVFAHFAVLLQALEAELWFMRGWSRHVLDGVCAHLDPGLHHMLAWPLQQLQ